MTSEAKIHSHLPDLRSALAMTKARSALEFGMGDGSTPVLCDACDYVLSIEMQDPCWYDRVESTAPLHWHGHLMLGPSAAVEFVFGISKSFDVVLVDGHGESRPEQVQAGISVMKRTGILLVHDTEEPSYGWDRMWPWFRCCGLQWETRCELGGPSTTVAWWKP